MRRIPLVPRLIAPANGCEKGTMSSTTDEQESVPSPGDRCTSDAEWCPSPDGTATGDATPVRRETRRNNHLASCNGNGMNDGEEQQQEEEDTRSDDFFYCDECHSFFLEECETHGPPSFTHDSPAPLGVPQRALLTLPSGLMVGHSSIPGAGLGVFNQGHLVPVGMHFGPYEGEVTSKDKAMDSGYSWAICCKEKNLYEYIDATRESHSNWMRYVNCTRNEEEQNLELLVWCAEEYCKQLGIICDSLWIKKCTSAARSLEKPANVFKCDQCKFTSSTEQSLQRHIEQSHLQTVDDGQQLESGEKPYSCCECGQSFDLLCELRKHERTSHAGEQPHCCSECGQSFSQLIGLKRHKQRHSRGRPYSCTHCDKTFCWFASLQRHTQSHITDKSYLCTECGKSFNQTGDFKRHQKIHTGERLYLCPDCGKSFSRLSSLRQHQRIHSGEKPYCCTHCGKCFSYSEQLKVHMRTHTGEKPFLCTECGESFRQSGDLKRHERKHTGVRPCPCSECGKSFSRPNSLKAHLLLHKGERPYQCSQCEKCFARTGHLRRHLRKMHS
ncbi:hypothetical protein GJAV_G00150830 [Gymnothorax javanicus]|nr:hypothetical protein GJAV_G00150830 [Gymnothorax javanicus]